MKFKLRPEIKSVKYWIHIGILALIVQFVLGYLGHDVGGLFTIHTLHFAGAIALADFIAHSFIEKMKNTKWLWH